LRRNWETPEPTLEDGARVRVMNPKGAR
jgi:hypothetical protein